MLANGVAGTPMYLLPHNSGGTESEGLINHKRTPVLGRINFSVWAVTIHSSQITNHKHATRQAASGPGLGPAASRGPFLIVLN